VQVQVDLSTFLYFLGCVSAEKCEDCHFCQCTLRASAVG